jgi:hypothetical protein
MYAVSATAAGVGILALAQPAEAKIIYTPAHVKIGYFVTHEYNLDLNHDSVPDFALSVDSFADTSGSGSAWVAGGYQQGNSVVLRNGSYVAALRAGVRVGGARPPLKFGGGGVMANRDSVCSINGQCTTTFKGPWANGGKGVKNRYLGLKFQIKGKTHYGWARLNLGRDVFGRLSGLLTGYAYETIPNKPIVAGKIKGPDVIILPADIKAGTLGHLALGRR